MKGWSLTMANWIQSFDWDRTTSKNQTSTKKTGIQFIDNSQQTIDIMRGLAKTALREGGKHLRKKLRESIGTGQTVGIHTKRFKNHIGSWVFIDKATGQPQLQVGLYSWQRLRSRGKKPSHASPHWIEYGTKRHSIPGGGPGSKFHFTGVIDHPGQSAKHLLRDTVMNNIDEIRKAEEEYLAELNNTIEQAGGKVYKGEDEPEDD